MAVDVDVRTVHRNDDVVGGQRRGPEAAAERSVEPRCEPRCLARRAASLRFVRVGGREVVVAVPQQAGQVVGRGAGQGILKVDDAEASVRCQQQVAAVVVAMNQAAGLAEGVVDERFERFGNGVRQPFAEQGAQEPLDEDAEFVAETGLQVRRDAGSVDALQGHETVDGERQGRVLGSGAVDIFQVPVSEVAQQEESPLHVSGHD